ncbi:MAG: V-type ATP synthase subunit E [Candidatus Thermoplasmatota archaeon]|nr:V-type ATP synthase subunit E [Candidatus Thermoplasmatota archaeon]
MNGVDKIIERIKKESEAKVKEIMDNANNEAENIRKRNEKETGKMIEKIRQAYENDAETVKNTILSGAKIESKRIQLQVREDIINECFIRAEKNLANMDGGVYEKFLDRIIREGVDVVGENTVMRCAEKDITVVKKIASSLNAGIDKNFLNTIRGVIIESKDGKIRVNNTFDGILSRNKESVRKEVAEILFGE